MPTKSSKAMDADVKKAMREMKDDVEFPTNRTAPVGPHHYGAGTIGGGSDTRGTVTKGSGRAGAGDEKGA
jgi:hypothetical protein